MKRELRKIKEELHDCSALKGDCTCLAGECTGFSEYLEDYAITVEEMKEGVK